ncbi:Piso0_004431 [Millerozyma farinosa CBS 7064]|uniref:Aspartate aminotransferase n=1 Tax=Pichia sorbitophila (strain ATCC MYA-4447 / BCRC 22081 / CBS 7064 / NBRC 10061 / NRRL Y-12695) TaxID=559304 RepID=G8Y8S7_PICSO|nr:Piso0_004431 [Millerozyma farinosa CBS 7064]CCE84872.1 Piso0_004431 [Millerozyma farinosa CBS 7064]
MSSYFASIKEIPPDPLFGLKARYTSDDRKDKVDLGIGAYRDNNGKPWILPSVREAEKRLVASPDFNHEYLGISGYEPFLRESSKVILGEQSVALKESRVVSQQSLSGTGALHLAAVFLKEFYTTESRSQPTVYLSAPTWANHRQIFSSLGLNVETYPYWNKESKSLDFSGYLDAIKKAPKNSIFILHACAHNPTGLDPTKEQWKTILHELSNRGHMALFDSAYQGFASGDLEKDAFALRYAVDSKLFKTPIVVCQSFAKNVGMYGERVGAVHVIPAEENKSLNSAIKSQLNRLARSEFSNPPAYGSKIVSLVLSDPDLRQKWHQDLITMSSRINEMRVRLRDLLTKELHTPGNWDHIATQSGMFSFTGLTPEMVERLEKNHGVYMMSSGRASVAGLNEGNVEKVAKAIDEVVRFYSKSKL